MRGSPPLSLTGFYIHSSDDNWEDQIPASIPHFPPPLVAEDNQCRRLYRFPFQIFFPPRSMSKWRSRLTFPFAGFPPPGKWKEIQELALLPSRACRFPASLGLVLCMGWQQIPVTCQERSGATSGDDLISCTLACSRDTLLQP